MMLYILIGILLFVILCVLVIYHDTHNFVVRNYEIRSDKVIGNFKFVFLSDLHGYVYGDNNEKLIKTIDEIAPDAVICGGDMFTAHAKDGKIRYESGFELIRNLSGRYKVFYGNGNHEYKVKSFTKEYGNFYDRYKSRLSKEGVVFLENDSICIEDKNIRITGLDLNLEYFRKVVKRKMDQDHLDRLVGDIGEKEKNRFQLLIAHNPQYFENYVEWGADLTLSGHVHGGIIRLPILGGVISPSIALFPKYDGGLYKKDNKTMILGRGLGTHTIHVRFLNPGEVCVINVAGKA
ncbi:MAG: metallophosphoesterase [Butyrivibrio sp.]|uniref:metallophosphoesterase n=1 Tax=Butyrivibrio sp. TaxID=28121 RepID=UPI001B2C9CA0|nr:metallophosphoesterase [Butyrivibrio sp.]MBO6242149.1 metallophosphoesterase [Butyrivibrio sp.]